MQSLNCVIFWKDLYFYKNYFFRVLIHHNGKKSKVMSDDAIEEINSSHMGVGTKYLKKFCGQILYEENCCSLSKKTKRT